jgi:hypothetical protein
MIPARVYAGRAAMFSIVWMKAGAFYDELNLSEN